MSASPRFVRLGEKDRPTVEITVDGARVTALVGDTLLVAMLASGRALRRSEFGPEARSGFCLMSACQDCWVWTTDGERLSACATPVRAGLSLLTEQPDASWPTRS